MRQPSGHALANVGLSRVSLRDGEYSAGLSFAAAAAADREAAAAGDEALHITALHMRVELLRAQGANADAVPLYQQRLEADERAGDPRSLAMEHYNLGSVLLQLRQFDAAEEHLAAALELSRNEATDPYCPTPCSASPASRPGAASASPPVICCVP